MGRAINREFDGIIAQGMAKQPAARFVCAAELASAAGEAALWDQPALVSGPPLSEPRLSPPPSEPPKTRPFEVVREPSRRPPTVSRVVLSGVTAVLFVVAVTLAGVLAFTNHRHAPTTVASAPSAAPPVTSTPSAPFLSHPVQGADALGFIGHSARCDPGNPPAAVVRTAKSLAVVCQTSAGYYYRGERIRDGANIEISNAVRSAGGFDVTNPANGVRYEVRPNQLTILSGRHVDSAEPVLQYASAA